MNFEIEYIDKLVKILDDNNLSEITLQDTKCGNDKSITIKKAIAPAKQNNVQISTPSQTENINDEEKIQEDVIKIKGTPITSPMVGTFYSAPSPQLPPFVKEGDIISKGQVICILEAMKLMNEIESDIAGRITKICVENGEAVEFGQVLMYVE